MNTQQKLFADKMIAHAYKAKRMAGDKWLPASIMASQSILETGWGRRIPTGTKDKIISYNCLGIKAIPSKGYIGTNGYVTTGTHEEIGGVMVFYHKAHFRAYNDFAECFTDYIKVIRNSMIEDKKGNVKIRYQKAIDNREYPRLYIKYLKEGGYATDSKYNLKVIAIAEQCGFIPKEKKC